MKNKYILAIPFFKNEHFIDNIISWYTSKDSENDKDLLYKVIVYNDCPNSEDSLILKEKCLKVGFEYFLNIENIGYLKTVNLALATAKMENTFLILLNSDTVPLPGFISEIDKCFLIDSMLGVVSARSNNATICNLYPETYHYTDQSQIIKYKEDHQRFNKYVPAISYVPVVTGFCFAISNNVINVFDKFDEIYTVGYEEENDYCLRISERGFRVGIANKAFVAHLEGKSFGLTTYRNKIRTINASILRNRFPYYDTLLESNATSSESLVTNQIAKAIANEVKYFIDARVLTSHHNGSNKFIIEFIKSISNLGLIADVITNIDAVDFHNLTEIKNINYIEYVKDVYEYGFMLGQPMHHSTLWLVPHHSLTSTCIFFDTIAHDCPQLRTDNLALDSIWRLFPYLYTDISFISAHSRLQFELKFGAGTSSLHDHLLPTAVIDLHLNTTQSSKCALVFGNKFLHKGIDLLFKELTNSDTTYYVLGNPFGEYKPNIIFLKPGETDDSELHSILCKVDYVLMPSFAEGFGFPLLEAISYNKNIYCRDIKCYHEIIRTLTSDQAKLIRIVNNFSDLSIINFELPISNTKSDFCFSYDDYTKRLFNDINNKDAVKLRNLLTLKMVFTLNTRQNPVNFNLIPFMALTSYKLLLKTPLANVARKAKSFLFQFHNLKKILVP